jgi:hypothetical protein
MIAFEVLDAPGEHTIICALIMSQRWMAEQWAAKVPGRTIQEIEVTDPEVIAVLGSAEERAWCERVGLVEPITVPSFGPGFR